MSAQADVMFPQSSAETETAAELVKLREEMRQLSAVVAQLAELLTAKPRKR